VETKILVAAFELTLGKKKRLADIEERWPQDAFVWSRVRRRWRAGKTTDQSSIVRANILQSRRALIFFGWLERFIGKKEQRRPPDAPNRESSLSLLGARPRKRAPHPIY
jgi:hypothetical protein